jgi:predicted transcriptional regulator
MNPVVEEMRAILEGRTDELAHYGMPKRSGRYPYGSGENPYQRSRDFLGRYEEYKKQGLSEREIAEAMNIRNDKGEISTGRLRLEKRYATDERKLYDIATAKRMAEKEGKGPTEIGREMGVPESTVRGWLKPDSEKNVNLARNTASFLKERLKETGLPMLDVGADVNKELNISPGRLEEALFILKKEGYNVYGGGIPQMTNPGQQTIQKVLCAPGVEKKEIYNYEKIGTVTDYVSHDGGETFDKFVYPKSLDSKRLKILLSDEVGPDGVKGGDKDGIVEIRRGVDDLSLGEAHYAQVRILVDNSKYIKGMAVYSDNMPEGVDVIFNTSKSSYEKALKPIKDDPDNPFGSLIKAGGQSYYTDKDGNRQLSLINKRADEGDWTDWKDALPSQFLGKQSIFMAKKQLALARVDKEDEFADICALENPTIKKHLLEKFADGCDSAAVHLQAAALPGQKYHVIIPVNSLKDNEVYAPRYENGSKVALIRYPHGGTFEIPILTVNNKNKLADSIIGKQSIDAVGINKKNADRLSGADFDGDTVMVIPTHDRDGKVKITSTPPLKGLEGFEPKEAYPYREGMKIMRKTDTEMGKISNLITDMTLAKASDDELARAVRHSMVVIDAEKHKLDYKQSEIDNNIAALKLRYQGKTNGGASTILSRSKGEFDVDKRQGTPKTNIEGTDWYDPTRPIGSKIYKTADPENLYKPQYETNKKTGIRSYFTVDGQKVSYDPKNKEDADLYRPIKKVDRETGEVTFTNKNGDIYAIEKRTQKSTKMAETDDAYSLVSEARHPMELVYADYANSMKALANKARIESHNAGKIAYSKDAKEQYRAEYDSLMSKLNNAKLNSPRMRAAERLANYELKLKKEADPDMKTSDEKKVRQQTIAKYRNEVGAIKRSERNINITDKEWAAIQAGAISESKLKQILDNSDVDRLRELATPRTSTSLSPTRINKIKQMSLSNYTIDQIAKAVNASPTTVAKYLKGAQ